MVWAWGGELRLTLHNGTLYWIIAARWVSGPGVSGKYAIALNYLNIDRLFDHILNVFYENGFINISAIGNHTNDYINNNDIAIRTMNNLFTSALFYGLNVGEVLLLPAKMRARGLFSNDKKQSKFYFEIAALLENQKVKENIINIKKNHKFLSKNLILYTKDSDISVLDFILGKINIEYKINYN